MGSSIIPVPSRINANNYNYIPFFRIYSNTDFTYVSLSRGLLPVGLSVDILKALLFFTILATLSPHLYFLDIITLAVLNERQKYFSF